MNFLSQRAANNKLSPQVDGGWLVLIGRDCGLILWQEIGSETSFRLRCRVFRGSRISPPPGTVASWGSNRMIVSNWYPLRFSQKRQWKPRTKPRRHEEEASSQRFRTGSSAHPEGELASSQNFISHRILCVLAPLCEPGSFLNLGSSAEICGSSPLILLIAGSPSDPSASRFAAAAAGGPVFRSRSRSRFRSRW